jgi:hypothetical protein
MTKEVEKPKGVKKSLLSSIEIAVGGNLTF